MSFLSRYWKQVERQAQDNMMNAGDVVVDINELLKNTEVDDNVVLTPKPEITITPEPIRPVEDEPMPHYNVDPDAWETRARRSARPGKKSSRMEREEIEENYKRRHREDDVRSGRKTRARQKSQAEDT